ncbi:MAG: YggS family pyridoxal phosphate-dependent enzyme [Bacteroidota bacterium]|uniref:Pyridoxal phosphate homeostasis protein n=1 Tax=Flagellimonas okinawensis TaxID=3031324 RepID=A0ABT5XJA0_9FLAO|nr:YggS family pyridoxal phosphate-dependent enzyme [[Muricauda] okinawensis]MDF0705964.1 YggS family pyridoxal phosphate-dependent enzyme [[Muricauda] okinawensis]MEC8831668.1 YggS family pyridoxal phosphate-dependent enzyme [Bacteroidota bacterium]
MSIKDNLNSIKSDLPKGVTLVAVSKTKPNDDILEAYEAGQRVFGENKVQEMVQKWQDLPKDIEWHMIGHVQRNKVKYMAEFVSLIHGVDSPRLLKEINKQAKKHDRVIPCLLQIHIAEEDTKFGLDKTELNELINSDAFKAMEHIKIVGLMGMATFTDDKKQVRREFAQLKSMFDDLTTKLKDNTILSMGMSGDYQIAIEEGSTMVRIGSSIFGSRNYS